MAIETEKGKIKVDWSGTYPKITKPESQPYRQMIMKKQLLVYLIILCSAFAQAQETYEIKEDIFYRSEKDKKDTYMDERCRLDLYYPTSVEEFPTIIWFHGGGITGGNKHLPERLMNQKVAIVAVNYRLSPKVKAPAYIEDAAAAVAWVFDHIEEFGGDSTKIFVSGHSAGGYLASMVGLDKGYLQKHNIDADRIAGLIPFSGHTITHFTIRQENGIKGTQPIIDQYAPLFHVRADAPPMLLITGDREMEMLGRYEENAYLMRMMKVVGHPDTRLLEMDGYGHGMTEPAYPLLLKEVDRIVGSMGK